MMVPDWLLRGEVFAELEFAPREVLEYFQRVLFLLPTTDDDLRSVILADLRLDVEQWIEERANYG